MSACGRGSKRGRYACYLRKRLEEKERILTARQMVRGIFGIHAAFVSTAAPNLPESPYRGCNQEALGPWTVVAPPTGAVPFPPWTDGSAHH